MHLPKPYCALMILYYCYISLLYKELPLLHLQAQGIPTDAVGIVLVHRDKRINTVSKLGGKRINLGNISKLGDKRIYTVEKN